MAEETILLKQRDRPPFELISGSPLIKTSGVSKDLQNQLGKLLWRWIWCDLDLVWAWGLLVFHKRSTNIVIHCQTGSGEFLKVTEKILIFIRRQFRERLYVSSGNVVSNADSCYIKLWKNSQGQATVVPTIRSMAEIYVTLSVELTHTEKV